METTVVHDINKYSLQRVIDALTPTVMSLPLTSHTQLQYMYGSSNWFYRLQHRNETKEFYVTVL